MLVTTGGCNPMLIRTADASASPRRRLGAFIQTTEVSAPPAAPPARSFAGDMIETPRDAGDHRRMQSNTHPDRGCQRIATAAAGSVYPDDGGFGDAGSPTCL